MTQDNDVFTRWSDAGYPRPQLCRPNWRLLNGLWRFAEDPADRGLDERWFSPARILADKIVVPYPPGSKLSKYRTHKDKVADVVWYQQVLSPEDIAEAGDDERLILHFEGIDYRAHVWVNGHLVAQHIGGFTGFEADITPYVEPGKDATITVRAEDRQHDLSMPRGKQDWQDIPHGIWYERSTGIWRDVWIETRPAVAITHIEWGFDLDAALITGTITLSRPSAATLSVELALHGRLLPHSTTTVNGSEATICISVPEVRNKHAWPELLWAPEHPNLVDVRVTVESESGTDVVVSYLGMREVAVTKRYLTINRAPTYVRGVLDQGYWAESYLTAPSSSALRREVELTLDLGFNTVRVHQRTPDLRYLAWADRLGLMVWSEFPAAYEFSPKAVAQTTHEWIDAVRRDISSPSVCVRVPFNESWGVPTIATDPAQQHFVAGIFELTKALDSSRPVISNDGWEQLDTDIITTHDYSTSARELAVAYEDADAVRETVEGTGPQGRATLLRGAWDDARPVMVSEFGGISMSADENSWGYAVVSTPEELEEFVEALVDAVHASPIVAGFCWTQLTDTGQETNGLCTADRTPKFDPIAIRRIFTNSREAFSHHIRPRVINEISSKEAK